MPGILLPSLTALGVGLAFLDYRKRRFSSPEDRYMKLYGKEEWTSNDMDMWVRFDSEHDAKVKATWKKRLLERLTQEPDIYTELAKSDGGKLSFYKEETQLEDLLKPRNGIYFNLDQEGCIHIVWNHMQMDGVTLWRATREQYDFNPPLVPYKDVKNPPPLLPELLSSIKASRQLLTRGSLYREAGSEIYTGFKLWDAQGIRQAKSELQTPFNLLTSALAAQICFKRHPKVQKLNLGITVYFPFLKARNRYGVIIVSVKRGSLEAICTQLKKKIPKPMLIWGTTAVQAYAMQRVPDGMFLKLMKYYRKQIDVLISNVPVGQLPIAVSDIPVTIACHTRGLSLPYYFLMMGTRDHIHLSYTSLFEQAEDFASLPTSVSISR